MGDAPDAGNQPRITAIRVLRAASCCGSFSFTENWQRSGGDATNYALPAIAQVRVEFPWQRARRHDSRHVQLTYDNVSASGTRFENTLSSAVSRCVRTCRARDIRSLDSWSIDRGAAPRN